MTPTRTLTGLIETTIQFIDDFQLPEPRLVNMYTAENMVSILFDGEGASANLISESLYWETSESGITYANVKYDHTDITVHLYESDQS